MRTFGPMEKASVLEKKIEHFWSWFQQMEGPIRSFFTEEEPVNKELIIEAINNRVLDFGLFTWEIGPGKQQPYYFLISPNGDRERLQTSRKIIAAAPSISNWEMYPARPIQEDVLAFSVYDNLYRTCKVDAHPWEFALNQDASQKFELVIKALNVEHLDEDTQFEAADRVAMGLLGEALFIDQIEDTTLVTGFEEEEASRSYPITQLHFRLEELLNG